MQAPCGKLANQLTGATPARESGNQEWAVLARRGAALFGVVEPGLATLLRRSLMLHPAYGKQGIGSVRQDQGPGGLIHK